MKSYINKILVFISPILLGIIILEILLRQVPNNHTFKKEYLDKNASKIETLILGSSHTFYGLNPEHFTSNTFNASHISQSLYFDKEILNKYKSQFTNLKTIILPISYLSLYGELRGSFESWRVKNYEKYYGINSSKSFLDQYYSEALSTNLEKNIRLLKLHYTPGKSTVSCSDLGWGTNYNSKKAKDLVKTGIFSAKRHTLKNINSKEYKKIFKENTSYLKSIIQWCKDNDVKIMLLTTPTYETYHQNLNDEQLNNTIRKTEEICSDYSNCIYLNYLTDKTFVKTDFFDADHLSEIGAKKLSVLIDLKIKEINQ